MLEAREFARGSDIDAILLLLKRPEPAVGPAPQPDARSHDAVGLLQAGFALQERFGVVVVAEAGSATVTGGWEALLPEEAFAASAWASWRVTRKSMEASGNAR